jgi:hypothetical protein
MYLGTQDFDLVPGDTLSAASPNRAVAHTFPSMPRRMVGATLEFRVRAGLTSGVENDGLFLAFTEPGTADFLEAVAYRRSLAAVPALPPSYPEADPGLVGYWNNGSEEVVTLDLSRLPLPSGGTLNLIPLMKEHNHLDVSVSDETGVDYFRLSFKLEGSARTAAAIAEAQPHLRGNSPNPFRQSTSLQLSIPKPTEATVTVFDVSGRLVRTVHRGLLSSGEHSLDWDRRDERGQVVQAGVYFYRLESERVRETRKMIVIQ